ncbi:uncharacterized protein [Phaseolus vulgaris]|uniref:uncharacterized protein n=1 Tax=Phaseolus vulgaris TaxID=3885 RepID=UPI0035CA6713
MAPYERELCGLLLGAKYSSARLIKDEFDVVALKKYIDSMSGKDRRLALLELAKRRGTKGTGSSSSTTEPIAAPPLSVAPAEGPEQGKKRKRLVKASTSLAAAASTEEESSGSPLIHRQRKKPAVEGASSLQPGEIEVVEVEEGSPPPPCAQPASEPTSLPSPGQQLPPTSQLPSSPPAGQSPGNEPNFMENPPSASTPFVSAGEGPPSTASIAEAAPGGDEGAHNSLILITESPTSPPRQEAQPHQPIQEGGGESQHQAPSAPPPTAAASLPLAVKGIWGPFTAKLKMMAEDLPSIITKAVESSNKKLQDDISTLEEENRLIRIEAEKLSCNLMMAEIDHSRVEDAMSAELRVARKETSDLRQKLHLLAQEKIELERKVKKERDDAVAKLAEAREENEKIAAELAQAREESKKVVEDLVQARRETEELKKRADELKRQTEGLKEQNKELELSSAQVLAAGFDAALEQVACQYPELDLSMVSICNEVVDGKIVPSED